MSGKTVLAEQGAEISGLKKQFAFIAVGRCRGPGQSVAMSGFSAVTVYLSPVSFHETS